jgi:ketosteroid isomerase-like protein
VAPRPRLTVLAACLAAALAGGGCASEDEDAVRDTIASLERALQAGDAPAVCRLYAEGAEFCLDHFGPEELRAVGFGGRIEVLEVDVDGDLAVAQVENVRGERRVAGRAELTKVAGEWLLVPPGGE